MMYAALTRDDLQAATAAPDVRLDHGDSGVGEGAAQPRVLIVDGDPNVAASLALMFADQGFVAETAPLGVEGVGLATAHAYQLIVLGADLPDMSGLEALGRLRQAAVEATVVFASLTAPTMLHLSDGA